MFRTGLVVGKFAPLHYGHISLILWAKSQCEKLIVLSYTGRPILHCDNHTRQDWFDYFYSVPESNIKCYAIHGPSEELSEDSHREFCGHYLVYKLHTTVDAVFSSEDYGDGFASFLTQYFKSTIKTNHTVQHLSYDKERKFNPISATQLRDNLPLLKEWCPPYVAKDFKPNIAILGGESSGKTTLAKALAEVLNYPIAFEYGRELCEQLGGVKNLRYEDYPLIVKEQLRREDRLKTAFDGVICDTTPLTTLWYQYKLHGVYGRWINDLNRYTHTIICDSDFDFVQDGTRFDSEFRKEAQEFYEDWYKAYKHPYLLVKGSVENRIQQVLEYIKSK